MYLLTDDFMTVWKLAHHWAGYDEPNFTSANLPDDLKKVIYRIMHAIVLEELPVRTKSGLMFYDKSFIGQLFEFKNYLKIGLCLRKGIFDVKYLHSLYLKRSDILKWSEANYLSPPKIWQVNKGDTSEALDDKYDVAEDEITEWYDQLTETRKQRVACLEIAKRLWEKNPNQSYQEIYEHSLMNECGKPKVFTFNAFKSWAGNFAPEYAKKGGRPKQNQ